MTPLPGLPSDRSSDVARVSADAVTRSRPLARRAFLGSTLAGAATVAAAPVAGADGPSDGEATRTARFAMITDTHVDVDTPERTTMLERTLQHIAEREPDVVLHGGDITDYGSQDEVDRYLASVPRSLEDTIHHVPGNHESQWNADAFEEYERAFGATFHTFDLAGLHVVCLDPVKSQQWPSWQFDQGLLDAVATDLEQVGEDVPIVMVCHFPIGPEYQFVANPEDLLAVIEPYRVRLLFSGHIHKRHVSSLNGLTQVVGDGLIHAPVYYWAERLTDGDEDRLEIREVTVPADEKATETLVATVPLGPEGPGDDLGPLRVDATAGRDTITVRATADASGSRGRPSRPDTVEARVYPQGRTSEWVALAQQGKGAVWSGKLDASGLPPGEHRVQVRASHGGKGPVWTTTADVSIRSTALEVAWEHEIAGGVVMADLAHRGDLVVGATTEGVLDAVRVEAAGATRVWRRSGLGGFFKGPLFSQDGTLVLAGSADHHLYALDAKTGATRWSRDLGAPVQGGLAPLELGGASRIGVAAGEEFFLLDLAGTILWTADLDGTFTGSACTDGDLVFVGSGDGKVHALDPGSGKTVWSTQVAAKTDTAYHRVIYGPWSAPLQLLSTGDVFVPAHVGASALDAGTGEVRWTVEGLHRASLTRPAVSEYGILVVDGKEGDALLLDEATGETLWHGEPYAFVNGSSASAGASPVPTDDPAIWWLVATTGLVTRFDLAGPDVSTVLSSSTAFTTSTAALVAAGDEDLLVAIDHPGVLRGITGLHQVG